MKTVLHKADSRGKANHGWLNSFHSFSFAGFHNPERMHFGVLRVLNDDTVAPGRGFGRHPHDNMEIISIPLEGELVHQDNMGTKAVIRKGDIQVMSAGTGVEHSEFNNSQDQEVKFLQIWVFPKVKGVEPRYAQQQIPESPNQLVQVLSPSANDEGVWINQNAWFHLGEFDREQSLEYRIKQAGNGVYAFVLQGSLQIAGQQLENRDGFGVWDTDSLTIQGTPGSRILLMEVPMSLN
jgi:quercetin 2,3-dioxygenase